MTGPLGAWPPGFFGEQGLRFQTPGFWWECSSRVQAAQGLEITSFCRRCQWAMLTAAISTAAHDAQGTVDTRAQVCLWHVFLEERVPKA